MSNLATQSNKTFLQKVVVFLVQGCGTGRISLMPGTWGTMVGLLLVYIISKLECTNLCYALATLLLSLLSWFLIFIYEKSSGTHDESSVVIDEIAGYFVCFLGIPLHWPVLMAGFVMFRFFDIVKPFPISWIDEKIPGAMGTLLDDLAAGLVVCCLLHLFSLGGWI